MHSSPIDALARAPAPQKAGPTETEPDGRFSDLLRQPAETGPEPDNASADPKPDVTEPTQDQSAPNVVVEGTDISVPGLMAPDAVVVSGTPVQPIPNLPEAITRTQPVAGRPARRHRSHRHHYSHRSHGPKSARRHAVPGNAEAAGTWPLARDTGI